MIVDILTFLCGLIVLYFGAEWLIKGAASLALKFGIRPMVVGLTVIALGTSMPEFLISLFAALTQSDNLAIGNIIGSNIYNIALILGISALLLPLAVDPQTIRKEYHAMLFVMFLFYALAYDGRITQLDGLILILFLVGFMAFLVIDGKKQAAQLDDEEDILPDKALILPMWRKLLYLLGGMLFLTIGARLMVFAAVNIADMLGISKMVIGLTVVAIGTSLPELAASIVAVIKDEPDMSLGNVLGSNMMNVLFVVGIVSLISPLDVEAGSITVHFPVMIGVALLLLPMIWTNYRITRVEGGILFIVFLSYTIYVIYPYL